MRARGDAVSSRPRTRDLPSSRAPESLRPRQLQPRLSPSSRNIKRPRRPSPWLFASIAFLLCCFLTTLVWWAGHPSSESSTHSSRGLTEVTYGSVIKLMHERTKYRLHSHEIPYGSGSQQQSVTAFGGVEDANSYWVVREAKDFSSLQGVTIPDGTVIRLQHMRTRKWLHSHLYQSPLSGNLEVSGFGGEGETDSGDFWTLEIEGKDKVWMKDQRIRLHHVETGAYLHSHGRKYASVAGGQQEVCGVKRKTADSVWIATEGVYLPVEENRDRPLQT